MQVTDAMIEAHAIEDANFAGMYFPALSRADRVRYLERSRRCLTAALSAEQTQPVALEALGPRLLPLIKWAHETLYEINPSNYDHDEVCKLNDASVEVILGLAQVLGEKHGYSTDWWEQRREEHPIPALVDVPAEPVAWRWKFDPDADWHYGGKEPKGFRFGDPELVEALYPSPPLSREGEDTAEVVKAGERFLKACDAYVDGEEIPDETLMVEYGDALEAFRAALAATGSGSASTAKGVSE